MPVEDALEALFTRYGGRGPTLGQKLLDYREYVDIAVEIQRQASPQWERVNPSRLSTGEAIGVGTALMMVVLTAWERAANLFRAKRSLGTLRLPFSTRRTDSRRIILRFSSSCVPPWTCNS